VTTLGPRDRACAGEYGSVWTPVVTALLVVLGATGMAPICRGYVDDDGVYVFRA